jgi:2-succinyl-6-hydroxy-2,4-cyclohexadiene-1-carboxylate synthase
MSGTKDRLMNYQIEGDGPAIILLHGMSSSLNDWRKLRPELVAAGYRVIVADLLGHGDSVKPAEARLYTMKAVYAVLEDWIASLGLAEPFTIVGHSLGGYCSLMFAMRNPQQLRKMVLMNPLYSLNQLTPALKTLMPLNFMGVKLVEKTPLWVVRSFLSLNDSFTTLLSKEDRRCYAEDVKRAAPNFLRIPATAQDLTPYLRQIQTPTLLIWGVQDQIEYPSSFPKLAEKLPNAINYPMKSCGHQPHHGNPQVVRQLTLDFLDGRMMTG